MMNTQKIRLALLLGGDSSEREISWKTGAAMLAALDEARYDVQVFDVTNNPVDAKLNSALLTEAEYSELQSLWHDLAARGLATRVAWNDLPAALSGFNVALLALHGGWGEDGTVQKTLTDAGLPYVGSPPEACATAMDKERCKEIAREAGLLVPRGVRVRVSANAEYSVPALPFEGGCVVKPNDGGSSVGVTILRDACDEKALRAAILAAAEDGSDVLIEELIDGMEITAAVLRDGNISRALPLVEIVPQESGEFYDYAAKYAAGGSRHLVPPRLPADVRKTAQQAAERIFEALGCGGVARSDFMVTPDGQPYFLEINTLPGMTATSLVPDAARAAGIEFPQLVEMLVQGALCTSS